MQALAELTRKLPVVWTLQSNVSAHGGCTDSANGNKERAAPAAGCASKYLEQEQAAAGAEKLQKEQLDIWNEKLGQTAAQVEKAQELFERIAREKQKQAERKQVLEKADKGKKSAECTASARRTDRIVENIDGGAFRLWISVRHSGNKKHTEAGGAACGLERAWSAAKRDADSSEIRNGAAGALCKGSAGEYQAKHAYSEQVRQAFLDAQAGFLAQQLVEGEPCPVCGSKSSGSVSDSAGFAHPVAGCS